MIFKQNKIWFLIVISFVGVLASYKRLKEKDDKFKKWAIENKLKFSATEEVFRRAIFTENTKKIDRLNKKHIGQTTFGYNQFSHLTDEEFKEKYLNKSRKGAAEFFSSFTDTGITSNKETNGQLKLLQVSNINWSQYLGVPRSQGYCNSDWAFAAVGVTEGVNSIKKNIKINYLSTQQLIDCSKEDGGCEGGGSFSALNYIKLNGIQSDSSYPYTEQIGVCAYNKALATTKISGWDFCSNYDTRICTNAKIQDLLSRGPLLVGIDGQTIQSYRSGIYTGACIDDTHAVMLVGSGVEESTGVQYWLVRNTWGATWGEAGHIRVRVVAEGVNNSSCFVANEAILPIV